MDIMSIIGLIGAVAAVVYGILESGYLGSFFDIPSISIVIGGTFASLMITFPLKVFVMLPKMLFKVFFPQKFNPQSYIADIVHIATDVRKGGLLAQEDKIDDYTDEFLKKGIQLAVDSTEADILRDIMETELMFMMDRHKQGVSFFEKGGVLAPAFGMIGTLIGLINMLTGMDSGDVTELVSSMGVALITTFYGSMLANVLFVPMANKLSQRSDEEVLCKQITIEGLISIINGENPRQIQEKLLSFIPPAMRKIPNSSSRDSMMDD